MEIKAGEANNKMKPKTQFQPGLIAATGSGTMAPGAGVAFGTFIVRVTWTDTEGD